MSAYKTMIVRVVGVSGFVMHSSRLVDPLSSASRLIAEITKKRKKTEADHEEMSRREFFGGLYLSGGEPCLPSEMFESAIVGGAKKQRRGGDAKAGIRVVQESPLIYDGPRKPDELWAAMNEDGERKFVLRVAAKVGTARVMRTRPIFREWAADVAVEYLPSILNERDVRDAITAAGDLIGIGDWRPRFGRFSVAD